MLEKPILLSNLAQRCQFNYEQAFPPEEHARPKDKAVAIKLEAELLIEVLAGIQEGTIDRQLAVTRIKIAKGLAGILFRTLSLCYSQRIDPTQILNQKESGQL